MVASDEDFKHVLSVPTVRTRLAFKEDYNRLTVDGPKFMLHLVPKVLYPIPKRSQAKKA